MNFRRIQWIFLIAFIILDMVLLSTLLLGNESFSPISKQSSQTQLTLREMRSNSISYPKLGQNNRTGYYLVVTPGNLAAEQSHLKNQSTHVDNNLLTATLTTPLKLTAAKSNHRQLEEFLKDSHQVLHGSSYQYSAALSNDQTIVFTQVIKGEPVLSKEGQIRFRLNRAGDKVVGYTQGYLKEASVLRPQATTISQVRAVTWLYHHNEIPNGTHLQRVTYGYSPLMTSEGKRIYVPIWQVELQAKSATAAQYLRVNAFSGTIIQDNN